MFNDLILKYFSLPFAVALLALALAVLCLVGLIATLVVLIRREGHSARDII